MHLQFDHKGRRKTGEVERYDSYRAMHSVSVQGGARKRSLEGSSADSTRVWLNFAEDVVYNEVTVPRK